MYNIIRKLGFLRTMLYISALLVVIFSPTPGAQVDVRWPGILTTVMVPALAPLIFMVIVFDLIMSRVVSKGRTHNGSPPLPRFFWLGATLALIILLRWLPHLLSLSI
ncbi:MAG: hypothetical protein GDA45_02560 [Chromatiales bacterium]|nr:hypothetical protein [Chromatiales bacterium]